jgi:hypothetical protein
LGTQSLDHARRRANAPAVFRRRWNLAGACLLIALAPIPALTQELIANQEAGVTALTRNEVRLYFTLAVQQWPNRHPVRVFVLPDEHPLHVAFAKSTLGLFPRQLRQVWDRQVFSGTGQAPTTVADEAEMIRRVATTPGAVGYTWSDPRDQRMRTLEVH